MSYIISLDEAKAFLQITGTLSDTTINTYIDMVESEISAYIGRSLALGTYTEVLYYKQSFFDRTAQTYLDVEETEPLLFLKNTPVTSLSLNYNGSVITTSSYSYNANTGVIRSTGVLSEPTASYVAGYTTVTAPLDLKSTAKSGVLSIFNNTSAASAGSGNVQSKRIKDFSVTYGNAQSSSAIQLGSQYVKTYLAQNSFILDRYRTINI